jgi:hypothetical protein
VIPTNGPFKRLGRRAYATLMAMSVVAIAAGCATTQWVPVTQARPTGDGVRLRVLPPFDSASNGSRFVTLYHVRMEDDSVLVGTPLPADTTMVLQERIRAASAFVQTKQARHYSTLGKMAIGVGSALAALAVVTLVIWARSCRGHSGSIGCP